MIIYCLKTVLLFARLGEAKLMSGALLLVMLMAAPVL